jgi:hypothetical protein
MPVVDILVLMADITSGVENLGVKHPYPRGISFIHQSGWPSKITKPANPYHPDAQYRLG